MYIKIISLLLILIGNLNANNSFVRGTVVSEQSEPPKNTKAPVNKQGLSRSGR